MESRRDGVIARLRDPAGEIPYLHIFALLTLLKQICDHPALVGLAAPGASAGDGAPSQEDGGSTAPSAPAGGGAGALAPEEDDGAGSGAEEAVLSGKWELYREQLDESLESGQKVVVYSQFLGMIDLIARDLAQRGIGHAVLTGKSRDRGQIVKPFNTDPACRVLAGSLRAGGVGVDLVAASVVIHYDCWWNAAKEDQATDRVHRIGQTRGVQVFKLVTEGTLEEKIAAIIARKKALLENVVPEDDPHVLKAFTREDLLAMLSLGDTPEPLS